MFLLLFLFLFVAVSVGQSMYRVMRKLYSIDYELLISIRTRSTDSCLLYCQKLRLPLVVLKSLMNCSDCLNPSRV